MIALGDLQVAYDGIIEAGDPIDVVNFWETHSKSTVLREQRCGLNPLV